jgi:predicted metal-dependent hydrolase
LRKLSATEKFIEIPDLGLVKLRRSARARRVNIRLKPFNGVELILPVHADEKDAITFLLSKKEWVKKTQKKISVREAKLTVFDENTDFRTRSFKLKIRKSKRSNIGISLKDGVLTITYPENLPVTHPGVQDGIRYGIEESMRLEAKAFLPGRLAWLAREHGFSFNNVTIKNLSSRWGSCSGKNNINLNLHIMRLPDELIDYILLHELCHTVEKNHGKNFWALLDKVTGGRARELDRRVNNYHTKIY